MLVARNVALRVNGVRVNQVRIRRGTKVSTLVITDPVVGEFAVDNNFKLELLELLHPGEIRRSLPNGGWRKVSLRILIALLRRRVVSMCEKN